MWIPQSREIKAVLAADGHRRYEYFVHRVCETKSVWTLYDGGWASLGGESGEQLIPFWPHEAYARLFVAGDWASFQPRKIGLDEFLHHWIPGMRDEGILPAIFPVPSGKAIQVTLDDLETNLREEEE